MSRHRIVQLGLAAAVFAAVALGVRQTATLGAKANAPAEAAVEQL